MTLEDMGSERWEALVRGLAAQIINATEPKAACALAADLLALLLRSVAVSACDTPDEGNELSLIHI